MGLRTLTVIDDTIKLVKKLKNIDIDIENIDLKDKKVLEMFTYAKTLGIFQFESTGMRAFLTELMPDRFEDLIAANSLLDLGQCSKFLLILKIGTIQLWYNIFIRC